MVSGIACGCTRTTTTVTSHNMTAILSPVGWPRQAWCIAYVHVIVNWHLSKQGVHWPVSRDHIVGSSYELIAITCFFWSWQLTKCRFSIGLWAQARLTCNQGWVVRKAVNSNPGLKVNQSINFSGTKMFLLLMFCVVWDWWDSRQNKNRYKTQIKILVYPWLA